MSPKTCPRSSFLSLLSPFDLIFPKLSQPPFCRSSAQNLLYWVDPVVYVGWLQSTLSVFCLPSPPTQQESRPEISGNCGVGGRWQRGSGEYLIQSLNVE